MALGSVLASPEAHINRDLQSPRGPAYLAGGQVGIGGVLRLTLEQVLQESSVVADNGLVNPIAFLGFLDPSCMRKHFALAGRWTRARQNANSGCS